MTNDYRIRGTAADGQIRFIALTSQGIVEEARKRHHTSPVMTAALGRLMSAGLLMSADMKGEKWVISLITTMYTIINKDGRDEYSVRWRFNDSSLI